MRPEAELKIYFDTELKPVLKELDVLRRNKVKNLVNSILIVLAGIPFVIFQPIAAAVVAGGGLIAYWIWFKRPTKGFKDRFKKEVIGGLVKFIDPSLEYHHRQGISKAEFNHSRIFRKPDRYKTEDLVIGTLDKTEIKFAEVHAEYRTTDSKGRTQYHTIFKGIYFVGDFNKHFNGYTVVLPDFAQRKLGALGKWFQKLNFARPDLVSMENPDFEKEFVVYSNDQVEARYILSTSLMERILEYKNKTGKKVQLGFIDSNICIAVNHSKNLYEAPFFKSMVNFDLIKTYYDDLAIAINIVEELNLNRRIWSKQ